MKSHRYSTRTLITAGAAESARRIGKWFKTNEKSKKHHSKFTKELMRSHHEHRHHHHSKSKSKSSRTSYDGDHGEVSKVYHAIVVRPHVPKAVIGSSLNELFWDSNLVIQGFAGQTYYKNILEINTTSQWLTASGNGFSGGQAMIAWFDHNNERNITGSSLYGSALPLNDSFCIRKSLVTFDFTNLQDSTVFARLHVFEAVAPTNDTILSAWTLQNSFNALGTSAFSPPLATDLGVGKAGYGGYTTIDPGQGKAFIGTRPDLNINTKKIWKKLRTFTFNMAGAGNHRMMINCIHNQICHRDKMSESAVAYQRGSLEFIVEVTGQVVRDLDTGLGTTCIHNIPYIGVVSKVKTVFQPLKANAARLFTQYVTGKETSNITIAPKIIDNNDVLNLVVGE